MVDTASRQDAILGLLDKAGQVDVDGLARRFQVSHQTVRSDLRDMEGRGLIERTRGGARSVQVPTPWDYAQRRKQNAPEKEAIGRLAASLLADGCSVALDIGTTTEQVARAMGGFRDMTVLSNNLNIITGLMGGRSRDLILVGGTVRQSDGAVVGDEAVEFISRYKVDFAIVGASAIDPDGSVLDFDGREVSVARAILRNARTRILVCDGSKFERTAPQRICDVGDLDFFVTDREPPQGFLRVARQLDTRIMIAGAADA